MKRYLKALSLFLLAVCWLYLIVVQLPVLLTGGGFSYLAGIALVGAGIIVPGFMLASAFASKLKSKEKSS